MKVYCVVEYELYDDVMKEHRGNISAVPFKWIDWVQKLVFWPPKSGEAKAISKWEDVNMDTWAAYYIKNVLLSQGSKDEATKFLLNYQTTDDDDESKYIKSSPILQNWKKNTMCIFPLLKQHIIFQVTTFTLGYRINVRVAISGDEGGIENWWLQGQK